MQIDLIFVGAQALFDVFALWVFFAANAPDAESITAAFDDTTNNLRKVKNEISAIADQVDKIDRLFDVDRAQQAQFKEQVYGNLTSLASWIQQVDKRTCKTETPESSKISS